MFWKSKSGWIWWCEMYHFTKEEKWKGVGSGLPDPVTQKYHQRYSLQVSVLPSSEHWPLFSGFPGRLSSQLQPLHLPTNTHKSTEKVWPSLNSGVATIGCVPNIHSFLLTYWQNLFVQCVMSPKQEFSPLQASLLLGVAGWVLLSHELYKLMATGWA